MNGGGSDSRVNGAGVVVVMGEIATGMFQN